MVYTCSTLSVAEQDDGVLECNRSVRRVWEMPSTLRFTQMQCRKCCNNIVLTCTSNDIDRPPTRRHPGASTVVMRNNESYWSGLMQLDN